MQLKSYASDLLEDAMILAQTKAINSFSFRDTINTLTELWGYCYEKVCGIDPGYYSQTVLMRTKELRLPPMVKNVIRVYTARDQVDFSRKVYKESGMNDLSAPMTYHLSGRDLYCWDGDKRPVWVEYIPEPPFVTFTKNNRDPKIIWKPGDHGTPPDGEYTNRLFGMVELVEDPLNNVTYTFRHRATGAEVELTDKLVREGFTIVAFILDSPWTFITYQNDITEEHESFVIGDILGTFAINQYNAFDYAGRGTNVKFLKAKYNDYTGLGVTIMDYSDGVVKELGWTIDTLMVYPSRIMYNYMVATVAQRLAALNQSTIMAVEMMVVQATDEMNHWMKKNKSAWMRANNVTGPTISDFL